MFVLYLLSKEKKTNHRLNGQWFMLSTTMAVPGRRRRPQSTNTPQQETQGQTKPGNLCRSTM